jgi:hypothetical protein
MTTILLHANYDEKHLEEVKGEMIKLGSPSLRGFQTESGFYLIEGCHRARAAKELGYEIKFIDISEAETVEIQLDAELTEMSVEDAIDLVIFGRGDLNECIL